MRGLRPHLTYANVMVTLLAIGAFTGGVAYAANTVFSSDIVDGEVKTADVGDNQIRGADVRDDSLTGGGLTEADLAPNSVGTSEADGLRGTDIAERTLSGLDANDGYDAECDPISLTFLDCDSQTTITLDRQMTVLVIAMSHMRITTVGVASGNCRLETNDVPASGNHRFAGSGGGQHGGMNLLDVQTLAPGTYTFNVSCNEDDDGMAFTDIRVAAIELAHD